MHNIAATKEKRKFNTSFDLACFLIYQAIKAIACMHLHSYFLAFYYTYFFEGNWDCYTNMNVNETIFSAIKQLNATATEVYYRVCISDPPKTVSDGIWGGHVSGRIPMLSSFTLFELQVIIIFVISQICHFLLKRLGLPLFISQMMTGLILGPSLQIEPLLKYKKMLFPYGSQDTLATVSSLGYAFFIFLNGVQMDMSMITRTGKKAWSISLIGLGTPLLVGFPSLIHFSKQLHEATGIPADNFSVVLISHSIISFAVVASLLSELKILNSELGRLALSSALMSEMLSITITSIGTSMVNDPDEKTIIVNLLSLFAFATLVPLVCRPAMFWVIRHTPEGRPVKEGYIYVIIGMVLALGWVSVNINQEFVLGAFILGLSVPEGSPLGSALVKKLRFFGTWFFLPIFVTTCVMKADLSLEYKAISIVTICIVVLLTHVVKLMACLVPALYCKMPMNDAFSLALILNCKGVVEVGMYSALYDKKNINAQIYGMMMISIMIIASIVKRSVEILYDPSRKYAGYQKRNIMSLKRNSELRVLACVHKHHHISPIIDVLELCCPTVDNPMIVDALHLIELVGRTSPIFISHCHRKATSGSRDSYSDNVIFAFDLFEHDHPGAASVCTYTAISPPSLMHEDVCHLALDKVASMVILPFHQRRSIDGGIESNDKNIRSINCMVLEKAPCSVGILVSCASRPSNSVIRLAMIFLGGKDDREALCLAKRATRDPRINLVVYHLVAEENSVSSDLDHILDKLVMRDVKQAHSGLESVSYREIIAKDGPQTAFILRDIVNEHDFFIVGRRHGIHSPQTDGLTTWSEFSELGTIGDLLASPDLESRASVLVVQQQSI